MGWGRFRMSQYMSFFIRRDAEYFVPLFTVSRNSALFQQFDHIVPYEKITVLSYSDLERALGECETSIVNLKESIRKANERKTLVASFNNSADEKMEVLAEIDYDIHETEDSIREVKRAYYSVLALIDIVDEICFNPIYDKDNYIYAGIEVCDPTDKDVIEK